MKKIILLYLSLNGVTCFAQTFYKKFPTSLNLDYDVAAVEISNGYILGDNEVNSSINFHGVVRLIRTDYSGNIIWAKQYDAGSGNTVHVLQLLKTSDNYILAEGYIGSDNNAIASEKFIMKLDTAGTIHWSKRYTSALAYQENSLAQVSDTNYIFAMSVFSGGNYPVLCLIDSGGNILSAAKFNVINSSINNIVRHNNSLDIILGNFYVLNTDITGSLINWQRQYNNTLQFNSLLSNRCANGDLIYITGQIAGGFGDGTSRIFRTDSAGNLKWSKNVLAWSGATSSPGTNFDAVSQVAVKETANGNIIGISLDEGGTLLFSVFDSAGNYLYNRNRVAIGQQHHVTETSSGNYLIGSVFGFNSFSTFSSYPIFPANLCDSILNVSITTGTDSITAMPPVTVSADTIAATDISLTSTSINISPIVFCIPAVGITERENTHLNFYVYPNPAINSIVVHIDNPQSAQMRIINVLGKEILLKSLANGENEINLCEINDGAYSIVIVAGKYASSRKLIVLKK